MLEDSKATYELFPFIRSADPQDLEDRQWHPVVNSVLFTISRGPSSSQVASGEALADAIIDLRRQMTYSDGHPRMPEGLSLFFDEVHFPAIISV